MSDNALLYDRLAGPALDDTRWVCVETQLDTGESRRFADPEAKITVSNGEIELRIEAFTLSHPSVQILDNPKYDVTSTTQFEVPDRGAVAFSVEMAAESIGCSGEDYRDGIAAFVLYDPTKGLVFDLGATSKSIYAIMELLPMPWLGTKAGEDFSWFVDAPLAFPDLDPTEYQRCTIVLHRGERRAEWFVNDTLLFTAGDIDVPESVHIGFGIFTLWPVGSGGSRSLRGQGMTARWRNFRASEAR